MIRLRLLGSLTLERPDGESVRSVLAQPKRFALLAYLAAIHPPAPVRRDTLVGLLWPELDEGHARMNLRQSLYQLRRSLGSGALTGKGDERVGVNPERIWCDVAAFERALEEERPEEALALYGGPLLKGFHLADAKGFERWLGGERRRLRLGALKAAEQLAARAEGEGDGSAARRWAERTLELAPYDEAVFRRYLELVSRQGDRATAVRAYGTFARRLAEDLELEPSAETAGLVERIRRGHEAPERSEPPEDDPPRRSEESAPASPAGSGTDQVEDEAGDRPPARTRPIPSGRTARPVEPRRRRLVVYLAAFLLLAALGYFGFSRLEPGTPAAGEEPEIRSLAVLPLDDLSGDPTQAYFTDGMTEALIAELGRLEGLKVISRTSAMHYRDTDKLLPEISRELDVDALIEGSVLRAGDDVRITLQLMHGPGDRHLWSASYQEALGDVLDLQKRIARRVAEELQISLVPGRRERFAERSRSPDPRAYEAYLKGRYQSERLGRESLLTAMTSLREAVALDSTFAPAYAALAETCAMPALVGEVTSLKECGSWARRAVELDDGLAEAHAALGFVKMLEWDWEGSERAFLRARELNSSSVMARQWYAELLRRTMRPEEALVEIGRAEELDPLNLFVKTMAGWPLFSQRRYEEAIARWDEVLEMDPNYGLAIYNRGLAYWMMGRPREVLEAAELASGRFGEEAAIIRVLTAAGNALADSAEQARRMIAEAEEIHGDDRPGMIAAVYVTLGREQKALSLLERGYALRDPWLPNTASEPLLDGLRDHPRFQELLRKMGLAAGSTPRSRKTRAERIPEPAPVPAASSRSGA